MMTARQIERWWQAKRFSKLLEAVTVGRSGPAYERLLRRPCAIAAAALGLVRLAELGQESSTVAGVFVRTLIKGQRADGAFGDDVALTAAATRGLMLAGSGTAAQRGVEHLQAVQRDDGSFPDPAVRRMPADAEATAAVIALLVDLPVDLNFDGALRWLAESGQSVEALRVRRLMVAASN